MAKRPKKNPKTMPKVHKDLKGMNIRINSLGEIEANYDVAKLNEFLNRNTDNKKLKDHPQLSENREQDEKKGDYKAEDDSSEADKS